MLIQEILLYSCTNDELLAGFLGITENFNVDQYLHKKFNRAFNYPYIEKLD